MITSKQIKDAMIEHNIIYVPLRQCSVCEEFVYYVRKGDQLFFDPSCMCGCYVSALEHRSWDEAVEWLEMQDDLDIKSVIANRFGLYNLLSK